MPPETPRLSELLELLYTARTRYRTVRLELVVHSRPRREREAMERLQAGGGRVTSMMIGAVPEETPELVERRVRVWGEPPSRWRVEREDEGGASLSVLDGSDWWMYHPAMGAVTNHGDESHQGGGPAEAERMLDPSPLLAGQELEVLGVGRRGVEVRARPRESTHGPWDGLAWGADEHRLVVDPERGVLLSAVSLLEGEELSSLEVVEIEFDVQLPPETFVFEPPEGVRVRDARGLPQRMTIEEVAGRASFAVFVLTGLEDGWHAHALYTPPDEGQETVHLLYTRHDAFRHVSVTESDAAAGWAAYGPLQWEERGPYRFLDRDEQAVVLFERAGTHLQLASSNLTAEELIALADGMEAA